MKCVITRDEDGDIDFWPKNACLKKHSNGVWWQKKGINALVYVNDSCVKNISTLLGFTPRRGSKQIVEITVKKLKGVKK